MSEVSLRVANFVKLFSMFLAIFSLVYLYAYSTDKLSSIYAQDLWIRNLSNTHIFYVGLGVFAVFNLIMSIGINMFKGAKGIDSNSLLFRSEERKQKLLVWLTYLQAGINALISSIVFYIALVKINDTVDAESYIYLPISGLAVLLILFVVLILILRQKS